MALGFAGSYCTGSANCESPTPIAGNATFAANVATALETAGRLLTFGAPVSVTIPSGTARIAWADVRQKRWFVDPTLNIPRYVVDILFAITGPEA